MAGYAKGILVVLIASIAIVILMNLAFFFPWYITLVETAFEVSNVVSNENYLPYDTYRDIYDGLKDKPIFDDKPESVSIQAVHSNGRSAIEAYPGRNVDEYYDSYSKPYVQRGNKVKVVVKATYPFRMTFAGREVSAADIPIEFELSTTTLKHYKDLDYYLN